MLRANSLDNKNRTNKLLLSIFQRKLNIHNKDSQKNNMSSSLAKPNSLSNLITLNLPVDKKLIECLYKIKARNQEIYQFPTFGNAKGSDLQII